MTSFQNLIFEWWKENRRDFPWRNTVDPYQILISEIMLQQTQTSRVIPKFLLFLETYPTLEHLASAENDRLLTIWSGLGYNRRALWLKDTAKQLSTLNYFPQSDKELIKFPGIGKYTSKSILIFAFNADLATVDTNIRRIFIHHKFADEKSTETQLYEIAHKFLPKGRSRDWHNALMDYGSIKLSSKKSRVKPKNRQSKFAGSNRQVRGQIVKYLVKNQIANRTELERLTPNKNLDKILTGLLNDGLIIQDGDKFRL